MHTVLCSRLGDAWTGALGCLRAADGLAAAERQRVVQWPVAVLLREVGGLPVGLAVLAEVLVL
ncbi:MAG: hypothetical protein M5U01_18275 [Ardenticatenaceae bacterium]|nr:hypothetical protein [Ardenticatenaceae bacterium]